MLAAAVLAVALVGWWRGGAEAEGADPVGLPEGYIQAVPRDFIEAVTDPSFVAAGQAGWSDDTDVIGVEIDGHARAYPVSLLTSREMVLDEIGGVPILVTWCPICATALVHERRIGDETLSFGVQGGLYRNAMTWYDHASESIWSQPFGRAIAGPRTGDTLPLRSSSLTSWGIWHDRHPSTLALDASGAATGFDVADLLLVVSVDDATRGYPVRAASRVGVVNDSVGDLPVAIVVDPLDSDRWAVHGRTVDGEERRFVLDGDTLRDPSSGARFDAYSGRSLDGGPDLTAVPVVTVDPGFGPGRTPKFTTLWPDATVWWPPSPQR